MSTTTRVSPSAPHEFLSYVPALVGFQPVDSVVFVAFRSTSSCGAMRIDLAPFTTENGTESVATYALDALTRLPGITGVLPVIYTSKCCSETGRIPHEDIAAALAPMIENRGLEVVDMLCVAADAWGGYLDESCSGRDLAMLDEPEEHPQGTLLEPSVELSLPPVTAEDRTAFTCAGAALDGAKEERGAAASDDDIPQLGGAEDFAEALATYVESDADVLDAELALIARLLDEPAFRDVIAYTWAWGPETGTHLWRRVFTPEQFTVESDEDPWMYAFAGRIEVRPDAGRLRRAIALLKRICALQRPDDRAPALTLISWCYWALGLSSFAHAWLRDALSADGTYGLAIIMRMILDAGTIPDWAFYDAQELDQSAEDQSQSAA